MKMKWDFYDVKAKAKVSTEVIGKKVYGEGSLPQDARE